jgi:phosphohistidine phosphatase
VDLVLWRHAEAQVGEPGSSDHARRLTAKGIKQAARMGNWLDQRLPHTARVYSSPAERTEQTAQALGRKFRSAPELSIEGNVASLLRLVNWPEEPGVVVVVGHQPTLGQVVAQLVGLQEADCAVRKGAVWWLRHRLRDGLAQTVVVTVQTPELL